jgi:hypothetical protein
MGQLTLTAWNERQTDNTIHPWRPHPLGADEWPPNYPAVYRWRSKVLKQLISDSKVLKAAKIYYSTHPAEFIMDWMDTYDPRKSPTNANPALRGEKWMPFVFFKRQKDVIDFFESCSHDQTSGLVEKCRDFGLTWLACGYSVWRWLFIKNDAIGWGSRKETLVDKPGDPDSIFEKIRLMLKRLPRIWLPAGFSWGRNSTYMKLLNPENGAIIAGEAGDNIGRGGRRSCYFLDEAAHLERPEKVEAALGDNTNVRIDISSVNGVGNVFHRRRENGVIWSPEITSYPFGFVRVFVADWRDHPLKTQEWYDARKARYEREGMAHIFAQEVDRNYAAAVSNTVIPYQWVEASIDAHIKLPWFAEALEAHKDDWYAGLDVADEGNDRNALTLRQWVIWREVQEWGERDPGISARKAVLACREHKGHICCQYDCIGVGSGVKTEYNRLTTDEGVISAHEIPFIPWNAGASVLNPFDRIIPDDNESLQNKDFFDNLKAQAWWSIRTRFYKTFKAVTEGVKYNPDELISIDSRITLLEQLKKELIQPTVGHSSRLKLLIEKKPDGMRSPNLADSGVMAFFPVTDGSTTILTGSYGF